MHPTLENSLRVTSNILLAAAACVGLTMLSACGGSTPGNADHDHDDHAGHDHGPGEHDHDHADEGSAHGDAEFSLGEQQIGPFTVHASRGEGPITPGGDAPVDATVTPDAGSEVRVAAVRFWIGVESGAGSVKARATVEDPANHPDRWHTHAEVPSPLPEGSMLWVEIEHEGGATSLGSFALNP